VLYIVFIIVALIIAVGSFLARRMLPFSAAILVAIIGTVWSSITIIDNGEVGVIKVLGKTSESELLPGLQFYAPWSEVVAYNALPIPFPYEGKVIASDKNPLTVSVGFSVKLNTSLAWKVQQKV
jgi:regulator of protease activity HflC (stomatin/prohibitin superfamily)